MSHPAADDKIGCLVEELRAAGFDLESRTADALEALQAERDALLYALRGAMQFIEQRAAWDDKVFVDFRLATARAALAKVEGKQS